MACPLLKAGRTNCMIEALFQQPNYIAAKQMMSGTVSERVAIGTNLANIETPHFHRLQVASSFQDQLKEALKTGDTGQLQAAAPQFEEDTVSTAGRLDGNNVVLEKEMMHLMRNSVDHAYESQLLTGNLTRLRLAITGRS